MLFSAGVILPVAEQGCLAILWVCIDSGFCPQKVPFVPTSLQEFNSCSLFVTQGTSAVPLEVI